MRCDVESRGFDHRVPAQLTNHAKLSSTYLLGKMTASLENPFNSFDGSMVSDGSLGPLVDHPRKTKLLKWAAVWISANVLLNMLCNIADLQLAPNDWLTELGQQTAEGTSYARDNAKKTARAF